MMRAVRWFVMGLAVILLADGVYIAAIWPDWDAWERGSVRQSSFIKEYVEQQREHKDWPGLKWSPVSISALPRHVMRAVIVAEDANFWHHNGIDTEALKTAMEYNLSERKVVFGASTISQQTVKNLFLSSSRNPLRKWHELVLTFGMEQNVRKRRILEIYLNVAEFGRGIYGVEAASLHYWGVHASQLTPEQAAELAATLPAPVKNNPHTRTRFFIHHYRKILGYMNVAGDASPGK